MNQMAVLSEILSGAKKTRRLPSFLIALLVTALVAGPMAWQAQQARDAEPVAAPAPPASPVASPDDIIFDTGATNVDSLDGATLAGNVIISYRDPNARAVAFNLLPSGGSDALLTTVDGNGPNFNLLTNERDTVRPLDTTQLSDGAYELFVTITDSAGNERRTAVSFTVENETS